MRKRILTACLTVFGVSAFAAIVVMFDPLTGRNLRMWNEIDELAYLGKSNCLVNPALPTNALSACYVTNGAIEVIPQAWLDGEYLASWIASSNAMVLREWIQRSNNIYIAKNVVAGSDAPSRLIRWQTLMVLDQLNTLRKLHSLAVISTNTLVNALSNAIVNDTF